MATISVGAARSVISPRRATVFGALFLVFGAVCAVLALASGPGIQTEFTLNDRTGSAISVGAITVSTRVTIVALALLCAAIGAWQLSRGFGRRLYPALGLEVFLLVLAFLTWSARGESLNVTGLLVGALAGAVPISYAALTGVMCERSGVINIGIEGMLLTSAFTGCVAASAAGSLWVGLAAAALTGAVMAWVLAVLAMRYRVDQIIAGTFINIFALGITSYLSARVLESNPQLNNPGTFGPIAIPLLSKIPILGPVLFDENILVYLLFAFVIAIRYGLYHTRWGLRVRAVGEHPEAADTVGIHVNFVRYRNVILGGIVAGVGGAFFTLGAVGRFDQNMTAGRGFIGLAAMIFGAWDPFGAFLAALVFGFADALQTVLSILGVPIPSEFLLMTPYVVTIAVVAGLVRRARPPAADGKPYP